MTTSPPLRRPWPVAGLPLRDEVAETLRAAGVSAVRPPVAEAIARFVAGGHVELETADPTALLPVLQAVAAQVAPPGRQAMVGVSEGADGPRLTLSAGLAAWRVVPNGGGAADALRDDPPQPAAWWLVIPPGVHRLRALRALLDAAGDDGWICAADDLADAATFLQRQGIAAVPGHPGYGAGRAAWERGDHDVLVVSSDMRAEGAPAHARVVFTRAPDAATLAAWRAACGPDAPFVILADEAEGPEVALPEAPERVRTERQLARLRGASPDPVPEAWLAAARALADSDDGLVLLAHGLAALDRALRQDEPGPPAPRTPEETRRKRKRKRRKATRPDERPGDDGDDDATDEITAPG